MRQARLARELEERHERQLRAGLNTEAAQTARELEEMKAAQIRKCSRAWTLADAGVQGSQLTKAEFKELLKLSNSQLFKDCLWRPDGAPPSAALKYMRVNGSDPIANTQKILQETMAMRIANEHKGLMTRAPLFVEPMTTTAATDADVIIPAIGLSSLLPEMSSDLARLTTSSDEEANAVFERMLTLAQASATSNPGAVLGVLDIRRGYNETRGDVAGALVQARAAVDFAEKRFGPSSIQMCPPLWQVAQLLISSGQPDAALDGVNRCLQLANVRGASSLTYASALNNLGVILHRRGEPARALDAYEKSLAAFERNGIALQASQVAAYEAPLQRVHSNLGLAHLQMGAVPEASRHFQLARQQMRSDSQTFLTERGAVEGMSKLSAELDVFLTVERAAARSSSATPGLALPLLLERKGFALAARAATMKALAGDMAQLREYRTLLAYRSKLEGATPSAPEEQAGRTRTISEVDVQIQQIEANAQQRLSTLTSTASGVALPRSKEYYLALAKALQKRQREYEKRRTRNDGRLEGAFDPQQQNAVYQQALADIAPQFKDYLAAQENITRGTRESLVQSIQSALPQNAVLVEMVRFRPFNAGAVAAERWSAARYGAYVLARTGAPIFVDCGEAAPIEETIGEFRRTLAQPRGTLARDLGRRLDAALMQPLRASLGAATQVYLSPDGALNLIPFGALVDEQDRFLVERFTFVYLSSGRDLVHGSAPANAAGLPLVIANPAFDLDDATAGAPGSAPSRRRSVFGNHFEPLPGTAAEAQEIKRLIPNAEVLTGDRATETAIKQARGPRVLHVATHGFFLQDQDAVAATQSGATAAAEDPMLRSGLVFAGVNAGQSGADDGVLTALEAAGLSLDGTQLVVLSACETGVGDIRTGEGVFGLRRAFMVAGAETLVMSLWQVDDDATGRLMREFYTRLATGEGRAEALRQASLALLRDPARRHPFYWASFIAAGEAGRMRP